MGVSTAFISFYDRSKVLCSFVAGVPRGSARFMEEITSDGNDAEQGGLSYAIDACWFHTLSIESIKTTCSYETRHRQPQWDFELLHGFVVSKFKSSMLKALEGPGSHGHQS